jgi:hypothetical protein
MASFASYPRMQKKVSHPNHGAQYLAQQIAIKRDGGGTRLVRLLTYLKVLAPRFTRVLCSNFTTTNHQSGQDRFLEIFNPRTSSSQPIAYTWKPLSRYSSRPWSRSSHRPRSVRPRFCSHTRSAERLTSGSLPCSKCISPGHFWYAVLRIDQKKDSLCDEERAH